MHGNDGMIGAHWVGHNNADFAESSSNEVCNDIFHLISSCIQEHTRDQVLELPNI